jgi:predicted  nucleic acid-binding Zn-ribbon protein
MGPTNIALVKLFQAETRLREAQGRLEATTKDVRIQERRVRDLTEKINAAQSEHKSKQARQGALDLDLKSRDAHIEKLRTQQQQAHNNKEYQAFLVEINTGKVDRNKIEEEALKVLDETEKLAATIKEMQTQLEGEKAKLADMQTKIVDRTASIRKDIDELTPARDAAAAAVPSKAREAFNRLAERFEGEALSAITKPNRRVEEYSCTACNLDLVRDVYNRLHTRDELVFCPSCRRILYIPEDLTPDLAVHKPKERKERAVKAPPAAMNRQSSAVDVLRSITPEQEEAPESDETPAAEPEASDPQAEAPASQADAPSEPEEQQQQAAEQPPTSQS